MPRANWTISTIRTARLAWRRPAWRRSVLCPCVDGGAAAGGLVMSSHLQSPAAPGCHAEHGDAGRRSCAMSLTARPRTGSDRRPANSVSSPRRPPGEPPEPMSHLQQTLVLPGTPATAGSRGAVPGYAPGTAEGEGGDAGTHGDSGGRRGPVRRGLHRGPRAYDRVPGAVATRPAHRTGPAEDRREVQPRVRRW